MSKQAKFFPEVTVTVEDDGAVTVETDWHGSCHEAVGTTEEQNYVGERLEDWVRSLTQDGTLIQTIVVRP